MNKTHVSSQCPRETDLGYARRMADTIKGDAWKDEIRECDWCGQEFKPSERYNAFCSPDCLESYTG